MRGQELLESVVVVLQQQGPMPLARLGIDIGVVYRSFLRTMKLKLRTFLECHRVLFDVSGSNGREIVELKEHDERIRYDGSTLNEDLQDVEREIVGALLQSSILLSELGTALSAASRQTLQVKGLQLKAFLSICTRYVFLIECNQIGCETLCVAEKEKLLSMSTNEAPSTEKEAKPSRFATRKMQMMEKMEVNRLVETTDGVDDPEIFFDLFSPLEPVEHTPIYSELFWTPNSSPPHSLIDTGSLSAYRSRYEATGAACERIIEDDREFPFA
jgi:hypothetical protein